ncbi:MAG: hypothetical protein WKF92_09065 [Pyrinomonadaceae bacterium]
MAVPFIEFAGNKRLLWIAEEWQRYSEQLADWAMERLVNRRDVWSQYTLRNGEIGVVMLPVKERRAAGTDMVTAKKLIRHFAGRAVSHLIGLHSISDHSTAKWFAVDVDLHDENIVNADEMALSNFAACVEWANRLREQNFDPILTDSNGVGGYHLLVLLDSDYPLADVYDFAADLRSDYSKFGLERKPEIFPPKRAVEKDDLPYTLRVFGRHHTRHHYSRVWNFDSAGENEWLEGGEAIEVILATRPSGLPKGKSKKKPAAKIRSRKVSSENKPRVCVDLDGVLAKYDGWKGIENIGPPLPGAVEFAKSLAKIADIVIFTSRCSLDQGGLAEKSGISPGKLRLIVAGWLEKHKIPFADIYTGQGKPRASAFIDDRAVPCSPQEDPSAFPATLKRTRELLRRRHDGRNPEN